MAKGKPYPREFRENAVRLSMTSSKSVVEVARDLGVPIHTLHNWRRQAKQRSAPPSTEQESLEQQNRRLQHELEQVREEAAILKKAIAYFAQPPKK